MKAHLKVVACAFFILAAHSVVWAQSAPGWKRTEAKPRDLQLFHSPHAINLPTAETLQKGDFEFEISHRFVPQIDDSEQLFGLDGPVNMRFALGYAPSNRMIVTLGRSNYNDNVDLAVKYKGLQIHHAKAPILVALQGGAAWNTAEISGRDKTDSKNFQYFGQAVINTLISKKLGLGLVPSYLHNTDILCECTESSVLIGTYAQVYLGKMWSVLGEGNFTVDGLRDQYDSMSFGLELETGGHFFKLFLTNNNRINPSQFLAGADLESDLRLGFVITRLLKL